MKLTIILLFLALNLGCGTAPLSSTQDDSETTPGASSTETTDTASETTTDSSDTPNSDTTESVTDTDETNESEAEASENEDTPAPELDPSDDCTLEFRAEVRDQSGPCTTCSFGDYMTVVGIIENPCASDKNYQATENCLVSEFIVMNLESGSSSEYPMTCEGGSTVTPVPGGGQLSKTRPAGRLSDANYHLTVQFKDPNETLTELYFTVQ